MRGRLANSKSRAIRVLLMTLILVAVVIVCLPRSIAAQGSISLAPSDVADLRVAVLRGAIESIPSHWTPATRLWVRLPLRIEEGAHEGFEQEFTSLEWSALAEAFPMAIQVRRDGLDLYVCPPGITVSMPGSSCPILEDGIIVAFGAMTSEDDGVVRAECYFIQTQRGLTRSSGAGMVFARGKEAKWELLEVLWMSVS